MAASQGGFHHGAAARAGGFIGHRGHGDQAQNNRASTEKRTLTAQAVLFSVVSVRSVVSFRVLTHKDVKNEDRSDYVYENTGENDIMSREKHGFLQENATITRKSTTIEGTFLPKTHRVLGNSG